MIIMHKLFKGGNEPKLRTKQPQLASALPAATDQLSVATGFYCVLIVCTALGYGRRGIKCPVPSFQELAQAIRHAHRKLIDAVGK